MIACAPWCGPDRPVDHVGGGRGDGESRSARRRGPAEGKMGVTSAWARGCPKARLAEVFDDGGLFCLRDAHTKHIQLRGRPTRPKRAKVAMGAWFLAGGARFAYLADWGQAAGRFGRACVGGAGGRTGLRSVSCGVRATLQLYCLHPRTIRSPPPRGTVTWERGVCEEARARRSALGPQRLSQSWPPVILCEHFEIISRMNYARHKASLLRKDILLNGPFRHI